MSEPRIIKKYPNRRLYDTDISSYITLEDVRKLILQGHHIQVFDARTHQDITHNTLLQIVMEQEEKGQSLFDTNILHTLIRFYGCDKRVQFAQQFAVECQAVMAKALTETEQPAVCLDFAE